MVGAAGPQGISAAAKNRVIKRMIDTVGVTAVNSGTAATVVWMTHEVTQNGGVGVETSVAVHRYLCEKLGVLVRSSRAQAPAVSEFARQVFAERLAAASLL